jgi:superfamily II DNA or RNA helicase
MTEIMANDHTSPFEKQTDSGTTFKSDLLSGIDRAKWPARVDYVASRLVDGDYTIGLGTSNPRNLSNGYDLERAARDYYLEGIAALTGDRSRKTALPDNFRLGDLLVEFSELREGLEDVERRDVPPGEVLSRLLVRTVQRQANNEEASIASQLRADAETPRELVAELTAVPELAPAVESSLPDPDDPVSLTTELASLDLTTELWDHQLESLALWLYHNKNAYVDMATATGKTVLGLAAVAYAIDSGSLHPADQQRLDEIFDGNPPESSRSRPNDVLIVTTDDLLGVQWARLFQEHCHTPSAYTQVKDGGIQLPWGRIDIRSADGIGHLDPSDYRLAIFDEVHNYSARSGWGDHLVEFIESLCPVLALTGSVTDQLESLAARADREFPLVYRYTHELALADGVIPDFEWALTFTDVSESDAPDQFWKTADQFCEVAEYDQGRYRIDRESLAVAEPNLTNKQISAIAGEHVSGSTMAEAIRDAGSDGSAPTDWLESLASGVSNRTIHRLNLRARLDPVVAIAEEALSEERPTLILTRSYDEAKELWRALYNRHDDRIVKRLEADQSVEGQDSIIQEFDDAETDEKVLIGPGKRIGQGNDIQSIEVGINLARPGSGVNATLVQRLGRLLRKADDKNTVEFYHVVGVPPADATIGPDGESFVRTVAEFFGQVLEPDTDGILKPPSVNIIEDVEAAVSMLERQGAPSIQDDEQSTIIESAYAAAISERAEDEGPTVATDWFSAAFGTRVRVQDASARGRVRQYDADGFSDSSETGKEKAHRDDEPSVDDTVSPLAEHYDAFRSLAFIHKTLYESAAPDIPASDPFYRWITAVQSILTEDGYGDQEIGYGKQQVVRSSIDISEYRDKYGNSDHITEFEVVSVTQPSTAITSLLSDLLPEGVEWLVPVTPESEVPLPVVVESEPELSRARSLLEEFPVEPPVKVDELDGEDQNQTSPDLANASSTTGTEEETSQRGSTPVADVRGVSNITAEALRDAGYDQLADLRRASDAELAAVDGVSEQRVKLIRASVGSR